MEFSRLKIDFLWGEIRGVGLKKYKRMQDIIQSYIRIIVSDLTCFGQRYSLNREMCTYFENYFNALP